MDNSTLNLMRCMPVLTRFQALGDFVNVDRSNVTTAKKAQRVHVSIAGHDWELLIVGPKFYDTRAMSGGGRSVDLVMYLWQVPFKQVVKILTEAGV